jgi:RNA polymerase sigma-70 factor (ECF subfamily)
VRDVAAQADAPRIETRFGEIVEEHRHRIYRLCSCYIFDPHDRQDVCQEVLIRIWQNLPSFRGESSLGTWIFRIAVNTSLQHLRSERRRRSAVDESVAPEDLPVEGSNTSPGEKEEDLRRLHTCISRLPLLERTLVSLSLEEVPSREIAEILGLTEVNVRVRLHRARKRLQELWGED